MPFVWKNSITTAQGKNKINATVSHTVKALIDITVRKICTSTFLATFSCKILDVINYSARAFGIDNIRVIRTECHVQYLTSNSSIRDFPVLYIIGFFYVLILQI